VPTHLIGTDAFQECDTVGITRPCTKHNWLVKTSNDLPRILHEAFYDRDQRAARPGRGRHPQGRPVPERQLYGSANIQHRTYRPKTDADLSSIVKAVEMMAAAKKPVFYTGGGVINSGPARRALLRELVDLTGFPVTSTLMGLGAFPAARPEWLGMLGMHGTYEANHAMHDCDLMICVGARFDDRITGGRRLLAQFEEDPHRYRRLPRSTRSCGSTCPSSPIALPMRCEDMIRFWRRSARCRAPPGEWWEQIDQLARRRSRCPTRIRQRHQAAICGRAPV
jgi:acetolactate synthase I/II/III large subunit